jgi:prephenate dehydratase/prephenate dehydrogenase
MRVAFLGPEGTNTDVALREFLPSADGLPCFSIAEVFRSLLEGKAEAGFVPIENMIQGPVTETLDALFEYQGRIFISDSHMTPIRNALGVLDAKSTAGSITAVYSHEQPLRQCSKYLSEHFPTAQRLAAPSTAAAVQLVGQQQMAHAAVIAPAASLSAAGLHIVETDISDVPENKTRFLLIRRGSIEADLPRKDSFEARMTSAADPLTFVTSIVIDPGRDRKGLLFEILNVISIQHHVNLVTIHSRPDTRGGVVFYLDLEGHPEDEQIRRCLADLRRYCVDSTGKTTEIHILGAYPRTGFYTLPFRSIGIIGSEGVMGRWFRTFFEQLGLEVLGCDKNSGLSIAELARQSDVLLLSVPMSSAAALATELMPHLRPGHLVVENCSIKSCVLPELISTAASGVEILGLHTMFGGDRATIQGENVIVTKTEFSGSKAQAFEDLMYKHGAKIHYSSIERHDQIASFVQSVIQLNMLVLGEVMQKSFPSLQEFDFMSTPNFRSVLNTMTRVLGQSDELLVDLQLQNEKAEGMRHRYLEAAFRLVSLLDQKDVRGFLETVERSRSFIVRSTDD